MKYPLTLLVALGLSVNAFATGAFQQNSSQSGVITYVATNKVVTTFPIPYTVPPVMQLFGSVTNLIPLTNSVTTTNFTLTIAATNASAGGGWGSVAWTSFVGTPQIQSGTIVVASTGSTNYAFTFPNAYAYAPVVVANAVGTALNNSNDIVTITAISTTGATITATGPITNNWISFGTSASPVNGTQPSQSTFPVGN